MNSKYIKTKSNRKLETKFFGLFQVLYLVGKQAYKLKLPKKWKVHNIFHVSMLEQNTIRKGLVSKKVPELDAGNKDNKKYRVEAICDSAVYANESKPGHLLGLYYLVAWKGYPKEENTWKLLSPVQYLKKLISSFHKDYPKKPTTTSPPIDSTLAIARPTVKPIQPITKRKQGRPASSANKRVKKN